MKVWKYALHLTESQFIDVPEGIQPLHFGIQGNQICLWAKIDTTQPTTRVEILCICSNWEIPDGTLEHIGTVVLPNQDVYHYFWRSDEWQNG